MNRKPKGSSILNSSITWEEYHGMKRIITYQYLLSTLLETLLETLTMEVLLSAMAPWVLTIRSARSIMA